MVLRGSSTPLFGAGTREAVGSVCQVKPLTGLGFRCLLNRQTIAGYARSGFTQASKTEPTGIAGPGLQAVWAADALPGPLLKQ